MGKNYVLSTTVFYRFNVGRAGRYHVKAHVPALNQPPAPAVYDAYVLDYFEEAAGETSLGEPVWSSVIDLTGSESYSSVVDEEGYLDVGWLDINLTEPELVTVVIRLRTAEGEEGYESTGNGYVVADAVKLDPEEAPE